MADNPYQIIKRIVAAEISDGELLPGRILPSEHALCERFGVSRMTASRAMRELATEGLVRRVAGVGSFVAEPVAESALVELHNIADEIAARGHVHSAELHVLETVSAGAAEALDFDLPQGATLFHSEILHFEDAAPLQLEDRLVSPADAPGYMDQDFTAMTPNAYLSGVAPPSRVAHVVQAVRPSLRMATLLALCDDEPCLLVTRQTWSRNRPVTTAKLTYPGSRFRLAGTFTPQRTRLKA